MTPIYDEALKDLSQLISATCDGQRLLARTKSALKTAKKEHELLELKNSEIKLLKLRLFYHDNDEMDDDKFIENTLSLYETREKIAELEEMK